MAYLYESDTANKYAHVKDKTKRCQKVKELKAKTDKTILQINNVLGIQSSVNLLDLESGGAQRAQRDATTGEFDHTKNMNNQ